MPAESLKKLGCSGCTGKQALHSLAPASHARGRFFDVGA